MGGTLIFLAQASAAFFLFYLGGLLLLDGEGCGIVLREVLFDLVEDITLVEEVHVFFFVRLFIWVSVFKSRI